MNNQARTPGPMQQFRQGIQDRLELERHELYLDSQLGIARQAVRSDIRRDLTEHELHVVEQLMVVRGLLAVN